MEIRDSIVVNAPVERVWEVFRDFGSYPEWNPFLKSFEGRIEPAERVSVKMDMGLFVMPVKPVLTVVEPPRELSWVVEQGSSFLYTVNRHFRFDALDGSRTHFVQSEESTGFLSPVISAFLFVPVVKGYRKFNLALKERAEAQDSVK
jgi:hypothetical protein